MSKTEDAALASASMAYARRLSGKEQSIRPRYTGDFDYMAVVNAAPAPASSSPEDHREAWRAFSKLFREEWRKHLEKRDG